MVHPRLPDARRKRRSTSRRHLETLVLEADALGRRFELILRQSHALLDPNFVMLGRWENRTEVLPANLADDSCYYQSTSDTGEKAAVGICGGMVRVCFCKLIDSNIAFIHAFYNIVGNVGRTTIAS